MTSRFGPVGPDFDHRSAEMVYKALMSLPDDESTALYGRILVAGLVDHTLVTHNAEITKAMQEAVDRRVAKARRTLARSAVSKARGGSPVTGELHGLAALIKAFSYTDEERTRYARDQVRDLHSGRFVRTHAKIGYDSKFKAMHDAHANQFGITPPPAAAKLDNEDRARYQQAYQQIADMVAPFAGQDAVVHLHLKDKHGNDAGTKVALGPGHGKKFDLSVHAQKGIHVDSASVSVVPPATVGGAAFDAFNAAGLPGLGATARNTVEHGAGSVDGLRDFREQTGRTMEQDDFIPSQRVFRNVAAGSKLLQDSLGPVAPKQVQYALAVGRHVGEYGPEAQKVIGPTADKAAYRYRGTERALDGPLVNALTQLKNSDVGDKRWYMLHGNAKKDGEPMAPGTWRPSGVLATFQTMLPKAELSSLQLASGYTPPSRGVVFDRHGQATHESVGYGDDHYLPFNLSGNGLRKLKGGEYIRTRTFGGPTTEDIYTGLMTGAKALTIVSHNGVYCLSDDTEILTNEGWRSPHALRGDETVLTVNVDTGLSEWQQMKDVHIFDVVDEPTLVMEGPAHSSVSTMAHRWVVADRYNGGLKIQTSQELGASSAILRAAPCADVPTEAKYSDALVEMVAWFTTEGEIRRLSSGRFGRNVRIFQSMKVNAPLVAQIRAALTQLFGPASDTLGRYVRTPRWVESIKANGMVTFSLNAEAGDVLTEHAPGKVVRAEFITALTRAQLALFVSTCMDADGYRPEGGGQVIAQKDANRLDAIEMAALLLGYMVNRHGATTPGMTALTLSTRGSFVSPLLGKTPGRHTRNRAIVENFTGKVWCPETPNGTWLARRNGKVYFTGNTVDFADDLTGGRRFNDKAARMVGRYGHLLDAVQSKQVTTAKIHPSRMKEIREKAELSFPEADDPKAYAGEVKRLEEYEVKHPTLSQAQRNKAVLDFWNDQTAGHARGIGSARETMVAAYVDQEAGHRAAQDREQHADLVSRYPDAAKSTAPRSQEYFADQVTKELSGLSTEQIGEKYAEILGMKPAMDAAISRAATENAAALQPLRLNGQGYATALVALQEQFPHYIADVQYHPWTTAGGPMDSGYVRPKHNRPAQALAGFFDPLVSRAHGREGAVTGKVYADSTRWQNGNTQVRPVTAPKKETEETKAKAGDRPVNAKDAELDRRDADMALFDAIHGAQNWSTTARNLSVGGVNFGGEALRGRAIGADRSAPEMRSIAPNVHDILNMGSRRDFETQYAADPVAARAKLKAAAGEVRTHGMIDLPNSVTDAFENDGKPANARTLDPERPALNLDNPDDEYSDFGSAYEAGTNEERIRQAYRHGDIDALVRAGKLPSSVDDPDFKGQSDKLLAELRGQRDELVARRKRGENLPPNAWGPVNRATRGLIRARQLGRRQDQLTRAAREPVQMPPAARQGPDEIQYQTSFPPPERMEGESVDEWADRAAAYTVKMAQQMAAQDAARHGGGSAVDNTGRRVIE